MTDSSRLWDATDRHVSEIRNQCQDIPFTTQWTRLLANWTSGIIDTVIPTRCTPISNDPKYMDTPACGTFYRGWIHGKNPKVDDG